MMYEVKRHVMVSASRAALVAGLLAASVGCNTNPVSVQTQMMSPTITIPTPVAARTAVDVLWVIDNSHSMCEEQRVLRENFSLFTEQLQRSSIDFHLAVTTTHAPTGPNTLEPVAREALIQSTPQPVPGPNKLCIEGEGVVDGVQTGYAPLRDSLALALSCLADPDSARSYRWTDEQIRCAQASPRAQQSSGCVQSSGISDRNADGGVDLFDLFPSPSEYRVTPKVLVAKDYFTDGVLDQVRLQRDFACMAAVGTRGDGYEKGLQVAVKAVSPELTGGALGAMELDPSAPNHKFLRKDAAFALMFVTDENDCSHDGSLETPDNKCGADACEYFNSTNLSGESPLLDPVMLAQQLREHIAASKEMDPNQLGADDIIVGSIHGTAKRFDQPIDAGSINELCQTEGARPRITPVCSSSLGTATSGDRYERFMRQFERYFPNVNTDESTRLDFSVSEFGWMCSDSFVAALEGFGQIIAPPNTCITDSIRACDAMSRCPDNRFTGDPGQCVTYPGDRDESFCDTGIAIQLTRNLDIPASQTLFPRLDEHPYCVQETVGEFDTDEPSCIIDPKLYSLGFCGNGAGIEIVWVEEDAVRQNKLAGYTLDTVYELDTSGR